MDEAKADSLELKYSEAKAIVAIAYRGEMQKMRELLRSNSNIVNAQFDGMIPLHVAVVCQNLEMARLLLENGADVDSEMRQTQLTALLAACQHENIEMVTLLLSHGANANGNPSNPNSNPLLTACSHGNHVIVSQLLQHGANTEVSFQGRSLLSIAVHYKKFTIAKLLLNHGAKLNDPYFGGHLLLQDMCRRNNSESLRFLLQEGANPNSKDYKGDTPLSICCRHGHIGQVQDLLKYGADLNQLDGKGDSPLSLAYPHTDVLYLLLRQSPLMWTRLKDCC